MNNSLARRLRDYVKKYPVSIQKSAYKKLKKLFTQGKLKTKNDD